MGTLEWVVSGCFRLLLLLAFCASAALSAGARAEELEPFAIYGDDDRLDVYQVKDASIRALADSVAWLVQRDLILTDRRAGTLSVASRTLESRKGLCRQEAFSQQPSAGFCSGALVAPDILLTAGHCMPSAESCAGTVVIFGNSIGLGASGAPRAFPLKDTYECADVIARRFGPSGADALEGDWALIRLSRRVMDRPVLGVSRSGDLKVGTPLLIIGHPSGLPAKVAANGKVTKWGGVTFFTTDLDTFHGNSGSPVFNAETRLIEGVLVRGDSDYYLDPKAGCYRTYRCTVESCEGESVTRISEVLPALDLAHH